MGCKQSREGPVSACILDSQQKAMGYVEALKRHQTRASLVDARPQVELHGRSLRARSCAAWLEPAGGRLRATRPRNRSRSAPRPSIQGLSCGGFAVAGADGGGQDVKRVRKKGFTTCLHLASPTY